MAISPSRPHVTDIVTVNMTRGTFDHLTKLLDAGLMTFDTGSGDLTINEKITPLIEAMYHVLLDGGLTKTTWPPATGTDGVLTITAGTQAEVDIMKADEAECLNHIREINKAAGFNLVIEL